MDRPIVAVVLAGGTGTRLYPAARSDRPKQFQSFAGDRSLLERTVDRLDFADEIVVVTRETFAAEAEEHAPDAEILVEPAAKDTGPALLYATHVVGEQYDDPAVLCLPSDHWIEGDFASDAERALSVAVETGGLVTMGIKPTRPATGYGYILPGEDHDGYTPIETFTEKPDRDTAEDYVAAGAYWNAGIFAWTPSALEREARATPLEPLLERLETDTTAGYAAVDSISIDYAVLERAENVFVVPARFEWDDLGTWDAVARVFGDDFGDGLRVDAPNTLTAGEDAHVTVIGVSDLVVVAEDDRVLVVPKDEAERVRDAVEELRDEELF